MRIDLTAATDFMTTHARALDRRRFELAVGNAAPGAALAALDGYRNPDGGYGWGLEPDLRAPESQPGGALHAFEVLDEVAPATSPRAMELCDWLASAALDDGGLPFALPVASAAGTAPFWAGADPGTSSLHITAAVTAAALRVARHDPAVAEHPWLERSIGYCMGAAAARDPSGSAYELRYALEFLDAAFDHHPDAPRELERLAAELPPTGLLPVQGGVEGEVLRPLDYARLPDSHIREHIDADAIASELDRLEAEQRDDGGWEVDFRSYSPAAALEWRGYMTVHALTVLQANGRL